jgi:AbiV family abortive infection protein
MKKKDDYKMNHSQIKNGVKKALTNALTLAGYSKDILERGGSSHLSLGLFSFAIEEYGKSAMLSEIASSEQKEYFVPSILFTGKKSHDLKFNKALSILPKECSYFDAGVTFTNSPNLNKSKTHEVGSNGESAGIPKATPGTSSIGDISSDFETRMNCFYLDWDKEKNNWKSPPKVLAQKLAESISEFENFVNKKIDAEYGS